MTRPARMRFGIFMAPFHRVGENPTLALERDLELIEWLDRLGYDEAWIGEHHSAGWETIASPEIFIGVASQRTRRIRLGTGVISLPYHHPLMVANRMVLLDHLTRGRTIFGVGPGALYSDAVMIGIEPTRQREMMAESLEAIMELLTTGGPVSRKTDWFELKNATLQLRPYTSPHLEVAVASVQSPAGMVLAGKHGAGVLSLGMFSGLRGAIDLKEHWRIAEDSAAQHGKTVSKEQWRLVAPVHLAETRQEALAQISEAAGYQAVEYFLSIVGRPAPAGVPQNKIAEYLADAGAWLIGSPDDVIAGIERFQELSGGFGGLMITAEDWATREQNLHSYELLARYVMPRFQGSLVGLQDSYDRARAQVDELREAGRQAIERAHQVFGPEARSAK